MRVHSLTTRFLLAILLLTTVPFLAFGFYAQAGMREELEEKVVRVYLPRQARDAAGTIHSSLEDAKNAGWMLAMAAAKDVYRGADQDFTEFVERIFGIYDNFQLVLLVDGQGSVKQAVASPALDADRHDELVALQPTSVVGQDWFTEIQGGAAEVWIDRHLSSYLHRVDDKRSKDPTAYSLGLACAVQTPDGPLGAVLVLMRWDEVQELLDRNKAFLVEQAGFASAEVFLCNDEGRLLAHTDRERYGDQLQPEQLRREVIERGSDPRPFDVMFAANRDGERHAGVSRLPSTSPFSWCVGLHATRDELFRESRAFGHVLLAVTAILAVFLAFWAWVSSRTILRPVQKLADATRLVAGGDLSVRVDERGNDELTELSRSFNTMAHDLAENRDKLREAERQAAWAEMARQVAHEIKNPLTPMRMGAQLLLKARRDEDERWESLSDRLARTVLQQTQALDRIAEDFRQFAGPPSRQLLDTSVAGFLGGVEQLVSSMAESSEVSIGFETAELDDVYCSMDAEEMRRVFLNLIHNAAQACEQSGHIVVRGGLAESADEVELRVEDDGPGVPEDLQEHLFEPYFTTKSSGTGLGLAICHKIVTGHGGRITLESSAPGHTVFLVVLPRVEV